MRNLVTKELVVDIKKTKQKTMSIQHHFRKSYYQRTLIIILGYSVGHFLFDQTTFSN